MSQAQPSSKLASDLCIACGMCCDGTLFSFVPVEAEEEGRVAELGFKLEDRPPAAETGKCFHQPCMAFRDHCCSIYQDRPAVCRSYRCTTIKAYDAGLISIEEARQRVSDVLAALRELLEATSTSGFHAARQSIDKIARTDRDARAIPAHSFLVVVIERMLDLHFRHDNEKRIMPRQTTGEP